MTGECECKSRVGPMFHCLKCMEHCAECNPQKLTDEVLADLLEKAERLYAHPCSDAWAYGDRSDYGDVVTDLGSTTYILAKCPDEEVARYIESVEPRMVSALVREVQALRSEVWGLRADERTQANAAEAARSDMARLLRAHAERDSVLASEVQVLRQELYDARKAATTAQTMAAHWKIQATGKALEED